MRILTIGAGGLVGHRVWKDLQERYDSWGTVRWLDPKLRQLGIDVTKAVELPEIRCSERLMAVLKELRPAVVVNAAAIVNKRSHEMGAADQIEINSVFPHRLAELCRSVGARLIHLSTDGVFSGDVGNYIEEDACDPPDLYGRSKLLGEVVSDLCLTVRTSFLGRELQTRRGLLEWFLAQSGEVRGFTRVKFNGLTTNEFVHIVGSVIVPDAGLSGIYHIGSSPISKYDLLALFQESFGSKVSINPVANVISDRTLNCTRFQVRTGYVAPAWCDMIRDVAADARTYELAS